MESTLTFAALDARIEALPEFPSSAVFPKKAKWGLMVAAAGALFGLLSVKLPLGQATYTLILAYIGLAVELAGVIVFGISQIPRKWPSFANECREFAQQLDFDLPYHLALVDWLQTFPIEEREKLRTFVSYRHKRMKEKLPMLTGSMEKLGALPIVIALYLQFKDMRWPPHPSGVEVFLIFVLIFGYWLCVRQISIRLRMQRYETLLNKALT